MKALTALEQTTAVLLAGGAGTRLRPVVRDLPKALAPVAGRPFLTYLLDRIAAAGIGRVLLCTGFGGDRIRATFGDAYRELRIEYSHEETPRGTGGALRDAVRLLPGSPALVLNGDSYCGADLRELWEWHHLRPAHATLVAAEVADASRFGRIEADAAGRVRGFAEKTTPGPGLVNAGIYLVHTELLARIPAGRPVSLERECLPTWLRLGLFAFPSRGRLLDIGTPESFAAAQKILPRICRCGGREAA